MRRALDQDPERKAKILGRTPMNRFGDRRGYWLGGNVFVLAGGEICDWSSATRGWRCEH